MIKLPDFDPEELPVKEIPAALAMLTAWELRLMDRMREKEPPAKPEPVPRKPDRMLTATEAAEKLRRSRTWLYRRAKKLPFAKPLDNRSWVFSENGIDEWLAKQRS